MAKEKKIINKERINDDVTSYYKKLDYALFNLGNEEFYKYFSNAFLNGNRKFYQKNISETKKFDDTWIKTVESYFPSIDKITREPKSTLKYDEDIVAVEKAKKTGAKSVRHLASHTQFIRDIDENRFVTPKKILVEIPEQEYAIYENRFIMTLVNRLYLFVRNRYEIIKNNVESSQRDHLSGNVNFNFNNTDVEMNLDITIKKDLDDKSINEHNMELLRRVEKLNTLVTGLKNSKFMQLLKNAPVVHPPIMKTNIIMKNPEFRNAYNLWVFLDKYSILGYDVSVKEKDLSFDDGFIDDVNRIFAMNYAIVLGNQLDRKEKYNIPSNYEEYTKKKTKIVSQNPKDFVPNPNLIEVEETHLNEYFLQKYKEMLGMSIEQLKEEEKEEEETDAVIKKALRQTTDIVNGLYDAKFEISEESDILHKLETKDLDKEYKSELEQLRYAKLIREVKEVDYNNFFRTEKRLLNALSTTNTKMIKKLIEERKYEEREKKIAEIEKKLAQLKDENDKRSKTIDALNDHQKLMKEEKDKIVSERNKVINRVENAMKEYDAMMIAKYEEEKERVLAQLLAEKERSIELRKEEDDARKLRKDALNNMIALEKKKTQDELDEKFRIHKEAMEKEMAEISAIATRYKEKLAYEAKVREIENAQREREEIAIFKVKQYEKLVAAREKMQLEQASLEYERALENARVSENADKIREEMFASIDAQASKDLSEKLAHEQQVAQEQQKQKNQDSSEQAVKEEQIPQEEPVVENSDDLDDTISNEKLLDNNENQTFEINYGELEQIKRDEEKRIEQEKFENERLRIEQEIEAKRQKEEDDRKQRIIAFTALQREKEARAISLVQDYEKKLSDEQEQLEKQKMQEEALAKALKEKEKFEEDRLKIEENIASNKIKKGPSNNAKTIALQRKKESRAISLVQKYEKLNKNAKSNDNA